MNPTKKIISILILVFLCVVSLVIYNAFYSFDRKFTVLYSDKYNLCFLISNDYTWEVFEDSFKYHGQKNHGQVTIKDSGFSNDSVKTKVNGFVFGYSKEKNYRIYEYQVFEQTPHIILVDRFEYAQKAPMNIVPYRGECKKFKENFKDQREIFASKPPVYTH